MKIIKILKSLLYDHSLLTLFRLNFHKVDESLYRSAQPNPYQLKNIIKRYNIKTIINLRGPEQISILELEREVCKKMSVKLIEKRYRSRGIIRVSEVKETKELLKNIEYPALIHCKAGSDRTGIVATLYLYFIKNIPMEKAKSQLNFIPYGHIKYGKTGMIDKYLDAFCEYEKEHPNIDFIEWMENIEDKQKFEQKYLSDSLWDFILNNILRRE